MEYKEFKAKFEEALSKNGLLQASELMLDLFYKFTEHLMEVNQVTNLTAIRDVDGIIYKHYVDSLLISRYIPEGYRVLDLGCGPGFPSLPLQATAPHSAVCLLPPKIWRIH